MRDALVHRGPDAEGVWSDPAAGVTLGHRRLAIIDISPGGAQPMASRCERFVIVFNGEIYNYRDLRRDLQATENIAWRGSSDTEVLLEAVGRWGFEGALARLQGQFAFALWDRAERRLRLARDRFGEKPLYYGWAGDEFVFGSELKALRRHPDFDGAWDRDAVAAYLKYGYVPQPLSIYRSFRKLAPGGWLSIGAERLEEEGVERGAFWSASAEIAAARRNPFLGAREDAVEELDRRLRSSVAASMVADVPLGAFLSGGIDSSTIVALMQAQASGPVRTFTIGTRDAGLNEAEHAKAVSRILGTEHTELYVEPGDALAVVPRLPHIYDEPFADSSQIPTFLVSALARSQVTVALSGDGGDELFGGYNRYTYGGRWGMLKRIPRPLRAAGASALIRISPQAWSTGLKSIGRYAPAALRSGRGGDRVHKIAAKVAAHSGDQLLDQLISVWEHPSDLLGEGAPDPLLRVDEELFCADAEFVERAMQLDALYYLPDDILVKVDRASMASSLEVRAPFLNSDLFRFAWSLPQAMKIEAGQGKRVLRDVVAKYVPRALFERPKQGFAIPIGDWLRTDLREWAAELLSEEGLARTGVFDPAAVRKTWDEHQSGARNWDTRLWTLLMFQAWAEAQASDEITAAKAVQATRNHGGADSSVRPT